MPIEFDGNLRANWNGIYPLMRNYVIVQWVRLDTIVDTHSMLAINRMCMTPPSHHHYHHCYTYVAYPLLRVSLLHFIIIYCCVDLSMRAKCVCGCAFTIYIYTRLYIQCMVQWHSLAHETTNKYLPEGKYHPGPEWIDNNNFMFASMCLCVLRIVFIVNRINSKSGVFCSYILSLALADLLLIVTSVPFVSLVYTLESWPWGSTICTMSEFVKDVSIGVSVFTLTALSSDRFFAIVDPLRKFQAHGK